MTRRTRTTHVTTEFDPLHGRTMLIARKALAVAIFAALGLAGCAGSQTKSDDSGAASSERGDAQQSEGSRETGGGIPSLEKLEYHSKAPTAKKTGEEYGVTAYQVGKLKILHKPTPANQVVSAKVYIDGGLANLSDETAGIERLALELSAEGGTESTPKDEFKSTLDSMGSSVNTFTGRDYSGYTLRCITKHFDASWELLVEAMLEPAMPKSELAVQRKMQLARLEKIKQNPNRYVSYLARQQIAKHHPYHRLHLGTESNVKNFTAEDLLAYQRSLLNPARMTLVVVGDVPTEEVVKKARSSLGRVVARNWSRPELPEFDVDGVSIAGATKEIPTNYIYGVFPVASPEHEDYPAIKVAMEYLSDRLFEEVRTKRSLSYAASSGVSARRTNRGYLYVSAKKPNEALKVIFDEVQTLKKEKLSSGQLERTRNVFLTEHFMDLETNSKQATNLARAELIRGDWRRHQTFLDEITSVTPDDVQRAARKYLKNYQFAVVGSPDEIDKSVIPD